MREKLESAEQETRRLREQLAELTRTATEYSAMLQKKEEVITKLDKQIDALKSDLEGAVRKIGTLQERVDTATTELEEEQADRNREAAARVKLQKELDELRLLVEAKSTEETRMLEVEKSKEVELGTLRDQYEDLSQKLAKERHEAREAQSKLKLELEAAKRQLQALSDERTTLASSEKSMQEDVTKLQASLAEAEKSKRVVEADLNATRARQVADEERHTEVLRAKEVRPSDHLTFYCSQCPVGCGAAIGRSSFQSPGARGCRA